MISELPKAANAMEGKTVRACYSYLRKRARWYCTANDAFLYQTCDSSVHSANQLASRHDRLRLQTSSFSSSSSSFKPSGGVSFSTDTDSPLAWHRGFTRKARTPRHSKSISVVLQQQQQQQQQQQASTTLPIFPFVPELSNELETLMIPYHNHDIGEEEEEKQLLYLVPVFDHFAAELCNHFEESGNSRNNVDHGSRHRLRIRGGGGENSTAAAAGGDHHVATDQLDNNNHHHHHHHHHHVHGFLPSDLELAEFAADIESLLDRGGGGGGG